MSISIGKHAGIHITGGISIGRGGIHLAGGVPPLFADGFDRADGVLGNGWLGGATWTIVSGKAVNTPSLGAELIVNGGFGADTNWTKGNGWTIAAGVASHAAGAAGNLSQAVVATGVWHKLTWTITSYVGGALRGLSGVLSPISRVAQGTYVDTSRAENATAGVNSSTGGAGSVDNVSLKAITHSTMFAGLDAGVVDMDVSAAVTLAVGTQAGVVVNLDSVASPANFVIGYHDGANVKLEKAVAGVYTTLISTAVAYSAGAAVRVVKSGPTTYQLWYGGVQRGADQSVSDISIVSNQLAGMFSTYEGNSLDDFSIVAS